MSLPVVPKKSLGQNFLNSDRVITKIVNAADPVSNDMVLEIGPGLGAITKKLIVSVGKVVAIEKDGELYRRLSDEFSHEVGIGKLELIHKDILEFDPAILRAYRDYTYKIVANIPYNLTGIIFRKFLSADYQPKTMVVLIQKEVATRILAKDSKESLLSLSVKAYGKPKLVSHVGRGNFTPAPNVDSSVIAIEDISRDIFENKKHEEMFFTLIHAGFAHKRKILISNLVGAGIGTKQLWEELFAQKKISPQVRSEDVSITDWINLAKMVYTIV